MEQKKSRFRKLALRVSVVLLSTLLFLALAEVGLRIFGFSYLPYPETIEFGAPNPQRMENAFLVDRDLLWVTKHYSRKMSAARRARPSVIFMGDSCTQLGRYDRVLERLVAERPPQGKLSYANLAVIGWSAYQGLQQLKRDIVEIKPRIVTAYYGWNDHWIGFGIEDKDVAWVNSSPLFEIQQRSRLAQLLARALVADSRRDNDGPLLRVSPTDFRANLTEMARVARGNGITLVLLTAPTSHEKGRVPAYLKKRHVENLDDAVRLHQQYASIVREVAESEDVILCDLAKEFDELLADGALGKYFHNDGIHLRPEGDVRVATHLYRCFEQNGLLEALLGES